MGLSDEDRKKILPSGRQAVYKNRIGWAHQHLKFAGLAHSKTRGIWKITPAGLELLEKYPDGLPTEVHTSIRNPDPSAWGGEKEDDEGKSEEIEDAQTQSPDERLDNAVQELRNSVRAELLDSIRRSSPEFFEKVVLDTLNALGYGGSKLDTTNTGGVGDGGIDGIIRLDRLGLEKVYIQAKRYNEGNTVGRPAIQGFNGALAAHRATKGIFITSSKFSKEAEDYAVQVSDSIVLVNGIQLADLMIENGVGVSTQRQIRIVRIDTDYFLDES